MHFSLQMCHLVAIIFMIFLYIGSSRIFTLPYIYMEHRAPSPHNGQTDWNLRGDRKVRDHPHEYTKFGQLIVRKIIKIIATRCHILRQNCTKFDCSWGSAPPHIPLGELTAGGGAWGEWKGGEGLLHWLWVLDPEVCVRWSGQSDKQTCQFVRSDGVWYKAHRS